MSEDHLNHAGPSVTLSPNHLVTLSSSRTILTVKERPHVPLEAEVLSPDVLAGKSHDEVRALPVVLGKRQCRLDDFFEVEGPGSDELEIRGDVGRVKWIGRGMTRGRIAIHGDAGMHLGAHMKGGTIEVTGNASDWVGAEMKGGLIRVSGNAGGQVGAAYRGSLQMKGGTLVLMGGAEIRTGAWMVRGTIISLVPLRLLPTLAGACSYQPTFLRLYARYLGR